MEECKAIAEEISELEMKKQKFIVQFAPDVPTIPGMPLKAAKTQQLIACDICGNALSHAHHESIITNLSSRIYHHESITNLSSRIYHHESVSALWI